MSNDMAVQALIEYLEESDEPELYWPQHQFEEVSFSRWAAGELIGAIMDHPLVSPEDTVEMFGLKMLYFAAISNNTDDTDAERIFRIASDFAFECLDNFRKEQTFYD